MSDAVRSGTRQRLKLFFALRELSPAVSQSGLPQMAIRRISGPAELGEAVRHRTNRYLNNHLGQGHRGIKQWIQSMGGFKSVESAQGFAESMMKYGTFSARAHAGMRSYRSGTDASCTQPVPVCC